MIRTHFLSPQVIKVLPVHPMNPSRGPACSKPLRPRPARVSPARDVAPHHSVTSEATAELEVRGSRFIGHVAPAESVEAARAFIASIREAHPSANHNVPAFRIRAAPVTEWANDDGEPGGSAGKPVLRYLQHHGLLDIVVVVTRYFGGTKLGVGGLSRAYTEAAQRAVDAAGVVERVPRVTVIATVEYADAGAVQAALEAAGAEVDAAYGARVTFTALVPAVDADAVRDRLRGATRGRAEMG